MKSKEPMRIGHVVSERTSHLTPIFSQPVWEVKREKREKEGERKRVWRERLYLLSRFSGDRSV